MEKDTFFQLCNDLEGVYHLRSSRRMTVVEKVGIFIFIIAQGASNRHAQERFQHSGETISHVFHEVLHAVCWLARDVIKPDDPEFKEISLHIRNDRRYMPHFKVKNIFLTFVINYHYNNLLIIFFIGLYWRY